MKHPPLLGLSVVALFVLLASSLPVTAQCTDGDSDGFFLELGCGTDPDCDDADPTTYPGGFVYCDGINNDCDDLNWPELDIAETDDDSDGWMKCELDCDDADPDTYPGAAELCDGVSNDCDYPDWPELFHTEIDDDSDGLRDCDGDCNDGDPATYPGATEICDGYDNDCSGFIDDDPSCDGACELPGMVGDPWSMPTASFGRADVAWSGTEFGVVWSDARAGGYHPLEIYFARLDGAGAPVGGEVQLTGAPYNQSSPRIVWTGADYGVAWADERDEYPWSYEEYFAVIDPLGTPIHAEHRVATASLRGRLIWTGGEHVFIRGGRHLVRLDREGVKVAGDVQFGQSWPSSIGSDTLSWTGSQFGLVWDEDYDSYGESYFARISPVGAELGNYSNFPDPGGLFQTQPTLAWNGSHFGVAWRDSRGAPNWEIYFALLDADGNKVSGDTVIVSEADPITYPYLVWNGTEFNLFWQKRDEGDDWSTHFSRIDASGVKLGESMRLELELPIIYSYEIVWNGSQYGIVYRSELEQETLLFSVLGCDCHDLDSDGSTTCRPDCDDSNPDMYHGNTEICDGLDNDCNGMIDDDEFGEDSDTDGLGNLCDNCPFDFYNDIDSDTVCGDVDNCPATHNTDQSDLDSDGPGDACDDCPTDPTNDIDSDTVCGLADNCPATHNTDQSDLDSDGPGDACDDCPTDPTNDIDSDTVCGLADNCPSAPNPGQYDSDSDDFGDVCDNCPSLSNPDQADFDGDSSGDVCDTCTDTDGDGYGNPGYPSNTCPEDNCPLMRNTTQADSDSDGDGDPCDPCPLDPVGDLDGDFICVESDNCSDVFNPRQADMDSDGEGDVCDADDGWIYNFFHLKGWLEWQEESGFTSWNCYKGDLAVLKSTGLYTQLPGSNPLARRDCGLTGSPVEDAVPPDPGDCAFFLTAGVVGSTEGSLGNDSGSNPRPNDNPCP